MDDPDPPVWKTWHQQNPGRTLRSGTFVLNSSVFIDDDAPSIFDENPALVDPLDLGKQFPKFSRPGAFVYLASTGVYVSYLTAAIRNLLVNFYALDPINRQKYDIVVIYYPDFTLEDKERVIASARNITVRWHPFPKPQMPYKQLVDVLGDRPSYYTTCLNGLWEKNYLLMGMFRAHTQFLIPMLSQYEYIWTQDADLYIKSPVVCDLFAVMKQHKLALAHYNYGFETPHCPMGGLGKALRSWARKNNINTSHAEKVPEQASYGGAFILHDMRLFTSEAYQSLAAYYIKTGGLWRHRWAEQNLWPHAVALLAPGRLRQFGGLKLAHNNEANWIWTDREPFTENC